MKRRFKAVGHFKDVLMKPTYTCLRKCPGTLIRFVLGTFLMKLAPGASFIKKVPRTNLKSVPGHFLRHV